MCSLSGYKNGIVWCEPMDAPCVRCINEYPDIYETIKTIDEIRKEKDNHG